MQKNGSKEEVSTQSLPVRRSQRITKEALMAITERHYVDDFLESFDTIEEAKKVTSDVIEVHRRGGSRIRNWASDSKDVLRNIPEEYTG
ncbi:hypothetical protein JTB14_015709 [Gonioctena quinquepunctata]|nr:hypothetical protein JTB14_015709 [Gonioctena quinquepunctata]